MTFCNRYFPSSKGGGGGEGANTVLPLLLKIIWPKFLVRYPIGAMSHSSTTLVFCVVLSITFNGFFLDAANLSTKNCKYQK